MNAEEIRAAESLARSVYSPALSSHAADRMWQKQISADEISAAVLCGEVIEAHNEVHNELRLLLRYNGTNAATCVVVAPYAKRIVTAWKNDLNDNHRTLDLSRYSPANVNIKPLLTQKGSVQ